MGINITLQCDGLDCSNSKDIECSEPDDAQTQIERQLKPTGKWLVDYENGCYYCPTCAPAAAVELGLTEDD